MSWGDQRFDDPLTEAIFAAWAELDDGEVNPEHIAAAVREFLASPPSEAEIDAAARALAILWNGDTIVTESDKEQAKAALVAARAVMTVQPPKEATS